MSINKEKMTMRRNREMLREREIPYSRVLSKGEVLDFLSERPFSLGWRWKYIYPVLESVDDARKAVLMLTSPVRNLEKLKKSSERRKIRKYLAEHPVIVTMTTSPLRLSKITAVLATLDLTWVSYINVVLPMRYGGNNEEYGVIPESLLNFPKVRILRIEKDLGPITKMLPTILETEDKKAIVISVDDDVAYPMGMINEFIYQKVVKRPKSVLMMGAPLSIFYFVKSMRKYWPERRLKRPMIDIVEGWQSVLYTPNLVASQCMGKIAELSKKCRLSDDFVISFVLTQMKGKKHSIDNRYAYAPHPYTYGAGLDALHAGRELGGDQRKYKPHHDEVNFEKYTECLDNIVEYVKLVRSGKEADMCRFKKYNPLRKKY